MNAKLSIAALSVLSLATLSPTAAAGELGFSLTKKSKNGALSIFYAGGGPWSAHSNVNCAPAHCAPSMVWVRGHYVCVPRQVWVTAEQHTVWVEPIFELRYDACGRVSKVCVAPGHWKTVCVPGHFETQTVKVFEPGAWVALGS